MRGGGEGRRAWAEEAQLPDQHQLLRHPPRGVAQERKNAEVWILRELLDQMDESEASEFLLDKMRMTKNNSERLGSMKR